MKQLLVPAALYGAFLSYSLCVFVFDKGGIDSFKHLEDKTQMLTMNLNVLEEKNAELTRLLELLRSDPATMAIAARNMGLYEEGQLVMQLPGKRWNQALPDAGKVLFMPPGEAIDRGPFRLISIATGLLFLITGFIIYKANYAR